MFDISILLAFETCLDSAQVNCLPPVVSVSEDPGNEPEHLIKFQLHTIEAKLDYMGSSILMNRISDLGVKVNDDWKVEACHRENFRPTTTNRLVRLT